ncbi:hypothetical protein VCHA51O444_10158 [Vibrio chagasii]|nr:hypothetical protein VCHA51O444_10158 [Vibrio chagasii]CAH7233687.1 hypothetical protein VCHA53O474_250057 [Vibrio chagasii]
MLSKRVPTIRRNNDKTRTSTTAQGDMPLTKFHDEIKPNNDRANFTYPTDLLISQQA